MNHGPFLLEPDLSEEAKKMLNELGLGESFRILKDKKGGKFYDVEILKAISDNQ